jgi:hypothetical protein
MHSMHPDAIIYIAQILGADFVETTSLALVR